MTTSHYADFTITDGGAPSGPGSPGFPGFDTSNGHTLQLQMVMQPAPDVTSCVYSLVQASPNAPTLTFANGGIAGPPPTSAVAVTLGASTKANAYWLRCTTNNGAVVAGDASQNVQDRIVVVRAPSIGMRKILVAERGQYDPQFGWTSAFAEMVDALDAFVAAGGSDITVTSPLTLVSTVLGLPAATDSSNGYMPLADKAKLDAAAAIATPSTLALRGTGGELVAADFATAAAASVANAGALRLPAGDLVVLAQKGASHASVPLLAVDATGTEILIGDGAEITDITLRTLNGDITLDNAAGLEVGVPADFASPVVFEAPVTVNDLLEASSLTVDSAFVVGGSTSLQGVLDLQAIAAPGTPSAGHVVLYLDNADGRAKAKFSNGAISILGGPMKLSNTKVLVGNNSPINVPVFGITGSVEVKKVYGVVTTVIGANHTASKYRLNDGTTQTDLGTAAAVALSAGPVGSIIFPVWNAAFGGADETAVGLASGGKVASASGLASPFENYEVTAKHSVSTAIEYCYVTSDTPTTGAIKFFIEYEPLSDDGAVTAL